MKKAFLPFFATLFSLPLLAQNPLQTNYLQAVLAKANPPSNGVEFYVVDSLYCHQFDSAQVENPTQRQYNLDFTGDGAVLESVTQDFLPAANSWQNAKHELLTYDAEGNIHQQVVQTWDITGLIWRNSTLGMNTWNAENDLEQVLNQRWHQPISNWRNHERLTIEYDNNGELSSFEQELWDTTAGTWGRSFRILYAVNGEGHVVSTIFQLWVGGSFKSLSRTFHQFVGSLETEVITEVWDDANSAWVKSSQNLKEYDPNGNKTVETNQIWLVQDTAWLNQNRIVQNFNADDQVTIRTELLWGFDQWVNFFQTENSYDPAGNLARFEVAQWQINEWVPLSSCDFYWRFHHEEVATAEAPAPACQLPNPYPAGAPIHCPFLPQSEKIRLAVFDLSGRMMAAENIENQDFITISKPLAAGIYLLVISGEEGVLLSQKIVVK